MNDIIFRVIVPDNKILFKTLMLKGERGLQGTSIVSIEKTQTIGLTDYYTITLNDGTTYEFTVQNGTNSYYDSDFSLVSENAVQNKVITAAINAINAALVSIQQYDNALSLSSENAVQNKVVAAAIDSINSALALLGQYDSTLSDSSENAVQNKVVKAALDLKANLTALNDYYNKTEIDAAFNSLGASGVSYNNASSGLVATDAQAAIDELKSKTDDNTTNITNLQNTKADSSSLATVATSGNFNDLSNKPTRDSYITYIDRFLGTVTFNASGYANISTFLPTTPSGYILAFCMVKTYNQNNGADGAMTVNCDGMYINGKANSTSDGVNVRYVYLKT